MMANGRADAGPGVGETAGRARPRARLVGGLGAILGLPILLLAATPVGAAGAAAEADPQTVADAIASIRGVDLSKMSEPEKIALGDRLDRCWRVLTGHPGEAEPAVRAALRDEREDSFRIIDLSHLLIVLDEHLMDEAAAALMRADPNRYPEGFFEVSSNMAARHCSACLRVVLRMLELTDLHTNIPEHALPVDLELGLIFTIGQFGDGALDGVRAGLDSENCIVRGNAALALAFLLPATAPPRIRQLALEDSCEATRGKAWRALGALDDPSLAGLAMKRLAAGPSLAAAERKDIALGLLSTSRGSVEEPLRLLKVDPDADVAEEAKKGLDDLEKHPRALMHLRGQVGSASPGTRSRMQALLRKAAKKGRFEHEGGGETLLAALVPGDLSLLNEARAAVLNRLSDECLYEYSDLSRAARVLRLVGAGEGTDAPPGAVPPERRRPENRSDQ